VRLSKLTTMSAQSSEASDQSSSKTWSELKARLVKAIDDLAPGLPAPIKGMMASALAQGTDDEIREKITQLITQLSWAIEPEPEEPMDEPTTDKS